MTAENKRVQTAVYEQSYWGFDQKNKTAKSLNANKKFLAEFYVEVTLTMYFYMLGEQSNSRRSIDWVVHFRQLQTWSHQREFFAVGIEPDIRTSLEI